MIITPKVNKPTLFLLKQKTTPDRLSGKYLPFYGNFFSYLTQCNNHATL